MREGVRPFLPRLLTFPTRRALIGPFRVGQPLNDASAARRTTLQKKTGATAETVEPGNVRFNLELSERKERKSGVSTNEDRMNVFKPERQLVCEEGEHCGAK